MTAYGCCFGSKHGYAHKGGDTGHPFPSRRVDGDGDDDAAWRQDGDILGPTVAFTGTTGTLTIQPLADIGLPDSNPQMLHLFRVRAV